MEEDRSLPQGICRSCYKEACAAHRFKDLTIQSSQVWTDAVSSLSQIDDPTDEDKTYYIFYSDGVETIIKDQVSKISDVAEAVHRLSSTNIEQKTKPERVAMNCECPYCGMHFTMPYTLNKHLSNASMRACYHCGTIVKREELEDHLNFVHFIEIYPCKKCFRSFDSKSDRNAHFRQHTQANTCDSCGFLNHNVKGLRIHTANHTLHHCEACNLNFESRKCFRYHRKTCRHKSDPKSTPNIFICDDCGAKYDKKPSLKVHMVQKHLNVLPYVCQTCGKRTSTIAHLKSHEKVHSEDRQTFECECGAKMRTYLGYQLHMRIHTGEKPYQCEECGDFFLSASRRLDHIKRRHRSTKDMPHACDKCTARFIRPFELRKHCLSVHYAHIDTKPLKKRVKKIVEETLCPPGVCITCTSAVVAAQEFRNLVRYSQHSWERAVNSLQDIPEQLHNSPAKSVYAFIKYEDISVHLVKDHGGGDPKTILNRISHDPAKKKADKKPRLARTGPTCDCPDCGQHFLSPYYLNVHLRNSGQKDSCLICGTVVLRGQKMKEHLSLVHNQTVHLCNSCPALFKTKEEMKRHAKDAHKAGAMTCGDCGRTFPRASGFEAHSQMHAVRTCRTCGTQFSNRGCYRKHRSRCEPTAKPDIQSLPRNKRCNIRDPAIYICDYCNKFYHSRPQLKNHILWIHMNIRPHQCQYCGKRFYTPARLAEHSVVHTRVRNYECDLCGAKLVSKMAAVYHRRRHTGEKPYACEDCDETFISASRRSEHAKRRHNKGPRIQCLSCPATFVRKHELKRHEVKAHSDIQIIY